MTQLIRKPANRFRVGEYLFLFGCYDPFSGTTHRGPYRIVEIKFHTDETITFFATRGGFKHTLHFEFRRTAALHRVTEPLVDHVIDEQP